MTATNRLLGFVVLAAILAFSPSGFSCGETPSQPPPVVEKQPPEIPPPPPQDDTQAAARPDPPPEKVEEARETRAGGEQEEQPAGEAEQAKVIERSKLPGYHAVKRLLDWEEEERNKKYSEEELARFRDIADGFQMFELPDEDTVLRNVVSNYPSKWESATQEDLETCCRPMATEMLSKIERTRWPSIEEAERLNVAHNDIPEDELRKTWYWAKAYLRDEWVRPGLKKRFVGLKRYRRDGDFLIARYQVDGNRIQILDSKEIVIAIAPAQPRRDSESVEDFIFRVATEFLTPMKNLNPAYNGVLEHELLGLWSGTAMHGPPGDDLKTKRFFDWLANGRAVAFFLLKRMNPLTGGFYFEYLGGRNVSPEFAAEEKKRPHKKFR